MNSLRLSACLAMMLGSFSFTARGAVIEVYPTGDPTLDGAHIQLAIMDAMEGDTILLKAGTFAMGMEDHSDMVVPLPDGDIVTWYDNGEGWQKLLVDKPLTICGEVDADGVPLAILDYNVGGFCFNFFIGASGVSFHHLEFRNTYFGIFSFYGGTRVTDCVWREVWHGPFFLMDERTIYPDYPECVAEPNRTCFLRNTFIDSGIGVHLAGSECLVADNVFDLDGPENRYFGVKISAFVMLEDFGLQDSGLIRKYGRNNVVRDNSFNGDMWRNHIYVFSFQGGMIMDNVIMDNVIEDMGGNPGILLEGARGLNLENPLVSGTVVKRNRIHTSGEGLVVSGAQDTSIINNRITSENTAAIWIYGNLSWSWMGDGIYFVPSMGTKVVNNDLWGVEGVHLGYLAMNSLIGPNHVDATGDGYHLDGPEDMGWLIVGPASGNQVVAHGVSVVDNYVYNGQIDNDYDGLVSEDLFDGLNDDGDTIWGGFFLIDEDLPEAPNKIVGVKKK